MSRILVFDLENKIAGEVHANVNRGWAINGGDSAAFNLDNDEAVKPWLQIGRMIFIDGGNNADGSKKLLNWAGMIDTPWKAITPVGITAYDLNYLMARRTPWGIDRRTGDTGTIASRFIDLANQIGELYLRPGEISFDGISRTVDVITSASDWTQLLNMATLYALEIQLRPEINEENRLIIYVDMKPRLGLNSGLVLQDGEGANMQLVEFTVDGEIVNMAMGFNDGSTETGKLYSSIEVDQASVDTYRARNRLTQFSTQAQSELQEMTKNYVTANGKPYVSLKVAVLDTPGVFSQLRLGNSLLVRTTQVILPGGQVGWSGAARITGMSYDEQNNVITLGLVGTL
ncbi:conserved hypothetical protein [Gammaproteobacteria bacterium]